VAVKVGAVTTSVTGIVPGLPPAPAEVTVTVPLYWPAARPERADALMDTLMEDGTVPLGVAESQEAPPEVEVEVVNEIPDVPEMLTDCAAGVLPPTVALKVKVLDGTVKIVEVTFNVTGMFNGLPPDDVI
jgi:hypothetical protein